MQIIDAALLDALSAKAAASPRLRANHNIHADLGDLVQRFLNAIEPGSYVRPHLHRAGAWEMFCVLRGVLRVAVFSAGGVVERLVDLGPGAAVEIAPGQLHSVVALAAGTVALELKPGPYTPTADKDFAAWAPPEGAAAAAWPAWLAGAHEGDRAPAWSPARAGAPAAE